MNPLKSNNIVAKILQVYAYLNTIGGAILAISLKKQIGTEIAVFLFVSILVASFFVFALGEIIDLLQGLKDGTEGKKDGFDDLPEL